MFRKSFNHTGTNSETYGSIPANSNFSISGTGAVLINGSIGENCYINKSGTGHLTIRDGILKNTTLNISGTGVISLNGAIGDNCIIHSLGVGILHFHGAVSASVKLTMGGNRNVIFDHEPPQTMIDNISRSGNAKLSIPGYQAPPPAPSSGSYVSNIVASGGMVSIGGRTFRGNSIKMINGQVYIDDQLTDINGPSNGTIITSSYSSSTSEPDSPDSPTHEDDFLQQALNSSFRESQEEETQLQNALKASLVESKKIPTDASLNYTPEKELDGLSTRMRTYIQSFDGTKKFSVIIDELKLTEEEAPKFEKFIDRITENYMDIPVELHEQFFDFSTLNNLKSKRDPFTQEEFSSADIQTARKVADELRELIKTIKNDRQHATNKIKENDLLANKLKIFSDSIQKNSMTVESPALKENDEAVKKVKV